MPQKPRISSSAEGLSDRIYSSLVAKAQSLVGPIFALHVGDTYKDPVPAARAEAQRSSERARLHAYAPVQGEPALIDAVLEALATRAPVARENVQIMAGATVGLSIVCQTILDPGDEVLLLAPFWPLMRGMIKARGAKPVEIPFFTRLGEPGFDIEKELERWISNRTVAIYVNSPHNPTGRVLTDAQLEAIGRVAVKHNLWIIDDQAYENLWYGAPPPAPLWARPELRDRTIASHTLSKSYAMAGARIAYTHGPAEVMPAIRGMQTFQMYCAPRPMQFAGERALREGDEWLAQTRDDYAKAARTTAAALGIEEPRGGTFVFFNAEPHFREGETMPGFLERCLNEGVLLTPGSASGQHYENWARLCFTAVPFNELEQALARLQRVLRTG